MGIAHYLAMTAEEIRSHTPAAQLAYMACHFSPYGTGITNIPTALPKGSMLILNDRIPYLRHDFHEIARQLSQAAEALSCGCVLLDFPRPDTPRDLGPFLVTQLSCPVGLSPALAEDPKSAVFLPSLPPGGDLAAAVAPWQGREVWLEAIPEAVRVTVDARGSRRSPIPLCEDPLPFYDEGLCCRYRTGVFPDRAEFTLQRGPQELQSLLKSAEKLGVTKAVSLYQHIKKP